MGGFLFQARALRRRNRRLRRTFGRGRVEVALPDGLAVVVAGVQGGVFRVGEVGEGHLVEADV